jgi:hypothetical protein
MNGFSGIFYLLFFIRWVFGRIGCMIEGTVAYIAGTASINLLGLVAADR